MTLMKILLNGEIMNKTPYLLIAVLLIFTFICPSQAVELALSDGNFEIVRNLVDDFNGDGIKETVVLMPKEYSDGWVDFDLMIVAGEQNLTLKDVVVNESPNIRGLEKIVISPKFNPLIGVLYHCGAHSWGFDLYAFDGKAIKKVAKFGSDGPSIQLKDVDKDGENEIVTESRDWDSKDYTGRSYEYNPVGNRFLETYKYDGKKWNLISVYETRTKKFLPQKRLATYDSK